MPITPLAPERLEAAQADLREQMRVAKPTRVVQNATVAADLNVTSTLVYRGRQYLVPPIPFRVGIELQEIAVRLDTLSDVQEDQDGLQEMLAMFEDAVSLFRRLVTPKFWLFRMLWRWTSNPFFNATSGEVAELLGFFSQCRMRSSVQVIHGGWVRQRRVFKSTRQTTSSGS